MEYKLQYDPHGDKHFNGKGTTWCKNEKKTICTQVEAYITKQDSWIQTNIAPIQSMPPKDRMASIYICGNIVDDLKLKKEEETDFTIQIGVDFSTTPVTLEYHMYPDDSVIKYGIGTTKKSVK